MHRSSIVLNLAVNIENWPATVPKISPQVTNYNYLRVSASLVASALNHSTHNWIPENTTVIQVLLTFKNDLQYLILVNLIFHTFARFFEKGTTQIRPGNMFYVFKFHGIRRLK